MFLRRIILMKVIDFEFGVCLFLYISARDMRNRRHYDEDGPDL